MVTIYALHFTCYMTHYTFCSGGAGSSSSVDGIPDAIPLKILLCGVRRSGKSSLYRRLQGQSFSSTYTPTADIQMATINWSNPATSDAAKITVWDVVDEGFLPNGEVRSIDTAPEPLQPDMKSGV
jgi:Ras of Complex, Roc, domain of DAPkinase